PTMAVFPPGTTRRSGLAWRSQFDSVPTGLSELWSIVAEAPVGEGHQHSEGPCVYYGRDLFLIPWKPPGYMRTAFKLTTITPRAHAREQRCFARHTSFL